MNGRVNHSALALAPGSLKAWPYARSLVVGMGKTGLSMVRFLQGIGVECAVTDSRRDPPGHQELMAEFPGVATFIGGFEQKVFEQADVILLSPGVSPGEPLVAAAARRGIPVMGDIEIFAHFVDAPVVAITGSNGKSTVTTLVAEMAKASNLDVRVGGNLGTPALELLRHGRPDLYVLELSSFQLECTHTLENAAAVVLNISADHLDRHATLAEYAAIKSSVYRGDGAMIINRDDPWSAAMAESGRSLISYGLGIPKSGEYGLIRQGGNEWLARGSKGLMMTRELRIPGRHNLSNALAALALGEAIELDLGAMLDTLRSFEGLPHRTQWVAKIDGVNWYNDSKGTNVGATVAAIQGLSGPQVLIAGGIGKDADFTPLADALKGKGKALIVFGRDADLIAKAVGDVVPVAHAASLEEAINKAAALAESGDAVLFSPACASFDMFSNYEERGRVFMALVRERAA
ncbi:MAG: UDP-N-acetylmuramoyl-L-alanine--D-glutamate ligase [Gammaproteobacteria bacterium]|nr:UDP-N-acetylmuramoyl-L-alanine--D-glutamate ligase [Gammaproteobacteria bacterium]MCP5137238.1 UDP-N-acetylmuramoyl-L-alanine--D-glutamate ligase [Gammaproteobacteria bacterium]